MHNFLITGIGGDIAQGIAVLLKKYFKNSKIIGCDMHKRHGGKFFSDKFFLISSAENKKKYLAALKKAIKKYKIKYLISCSESEIELINKQTDKFFKLNFISPGKKAINICLDKYKTKLFLDSIGVSTPWTVESHLEFPKSYPCIFKKKRSSGSKFLQIIRDKSEAKFMLKKYKDTIFQELLLPNDQEITCAVFRSSKGIIKILQLKRRLTGGFTSWAKVINNSKINKVCIKIAKELDLVGSLNIQLILTSKGPKIFEINPRFSSTIYLRSLVGFNDLIWSIKDKNKSTINFPKIKTGIELSKTYSAVKL